MYGYYDSIVKQNTGPIWVQGEQAAKSYPVAPGATVMLMDSEQSRFYMKSADLSGMPMPLRTFEFTEVTQISPVSPSSFDPTKFVTKDELKEMLANLPVCKCKEEEHESAV